MTEASISDRMQALAECAVEAARGEYAVDLDYSEASLERVEKMLGSIYDERPKGRLNRLFRRGLSQQELEILARSFGAYVGEVIRRRWGGEWSTQTDAQPGRVITLHVGGAQVFPTSKVYKRY